MQFIQKPKPIKKRPELKLGDIFEISTGTRFLVVRPLTQKGSAANFYYDNQGYTTVNITANSLTLNMVCNTLEELTEKCYNKYLITAIYSEQRIKVDLGEPK